MPPAAYSTSSSDAFGNGAEHCPSNRWLPWHSIVVFLSMHTEHGGNIMLQFRTMCKVAFIHVGLKKQTFSIIFTDGEEWCLEDGQEGQEVYLHWLMCSVSHEQAHP